MSYWVLKIVVNLWAVGTPPQSRWGSSQRSPRPPSRWGGLDAPSPSTPPRYRPSASMFGPSVLPQWEILNTPLFSSRFIRRIDTTFGLFWNDILPKIIRTNICRPAWAEFEKISHLCTEMHNFCLRYRKISEERYSPFPDSSPLGRGHPSPHPTPFAASRGLAVHSVINFTAGRCGRELTDYSYYRRPIGLSRIKILTEIVEPQPSTTDATSTILFWKLVGRSGRDGTGSVTLTRDPTRPGTPVTSDLDWPGDPD